MPLELKPLKKKCDVITFGEGRGKVSLKVRGSLPYDLMIEFYDLGNMDVKNVKVDDLKSVSRLIKEILYLENDKIKVDKFIGSLEQEEVETVIAFIGNYLAVCKDSKKKDSKAVSKK